MNLFNATEFYTLKWLHFTSEKECVNEPFKCFRGKADTGYSQIRGNHSETVVRTRSGSLREQGKMLGC